MAGSPYNVPMPSDEEIAETIQSLRAEIAEKVELANSIEDKDEQLVQLAMVASRCAMLAYLLRLSSGETNIEPPSFWLGGVAGILMESELNNAMAMVRQHSANN